MLGFIPREPREASTVDIAQRLLDSGFSCDKRTVERDLDNLSSVFPYTSEKRGRTNYWFWPRDSAVLDLPAMEPSTALVFDLVREYSESLLPKSTLKLLKPYFDKASIVLDTAASQKLGKWRRRVKLISRGPQLLNPKLDSAVQEAVYTALLEEKRLSIVYKSRWDDQPSEREFSPLAMVVREGVFYLIGPMWDYPDVVQIAVHRISRARITESKLNKPGKFSLNKYLEENEFAYPVSQSQIKLKFRIREDAARHLRERPLSAEQKIAGGEDGWATIEAKVSDTDELRWWLLGFGDKVEVLAPIRLRREFAEIAKSLSSTYS